jgi:hypothetical protein
MRRAVVLLLALLVPGCAALELQGPRPCGPQPCRETLKVAVAAFRDERVVEEIGTPQDRPFVVAAAPVDAMSTELAQHLVERLTAAEVFQSATLVDVSGSTPAPELLARLAGEGYDAVLTGNVPHCLGSTCVTGGNLAGYVALRFIGLIYPVILPLPFGLYHNEGVVSIADLRLTDTRTGEVLWRGDFIRRVVHYSGDPSPGPAIHEAMHDITQEIIKDLRQRLRSGRQGAPGPDEP